eukprot:s2602_g12.t1
MRNSDFIRGPRVVCRSDVFCRRRSWAATRRRGQKSATLFFRAKAHPGRSQIVAQLRPEIGVVPLPTSLAAENPAEPSDTVV